MTGWELAMTTAHQKDNSPTSRRVLVSNTATNMLSSLYPLSKPQVNAALARIKSSVLDPTKIKRIIGVDNAFVARDGDLRVVFQNDGDSVVITSVVARD